MRLEDNKSSKLDHELQVLLDEFAARREQGEELSPAKFAFQNPAYADELMRALEPVGSREQVQPPGDSPQPGPSFRPGQLPTFPGYQVISELGRGGGGVVYLVKDKESDQRYALKYLTQIGHRATNRALRFRQEAQLQQKLVHPNIVSVKEFSDDPNLPYIVVELIDGSQTVLDLLRETKSGMSKDVVLEMMIGICDAVAYGHDQGVVHRDIKPSNIMLDNMTPKLTDYGLAMSTDQDMTRLTQPEQMLGTLAYLPPELLAGGLVATEAADIYSLGMTMYEMLTRDVPFDHPEAAVMLKLIADGDPQSPREKSHAIDARLDAVIMKCIEKEPEARYPTAVALRDDLLRIKAGGSVAAPQVAPAKRKLRRFLHSKKPALLLATSVVLLLTVGLTMVWEERRYQQNLALLRESRGDVGAAVRFELPFLMEASRQEDPKVRLAALRAMHRKGGPGTIRRLVEALKRDPDPAVRAALAKLLEEREKPDDPPAIKPPDVKPPPDPVVVEVTDPPDNKPSETVLLPLPVPKINTAPPVSDAQLSSFEGLLDDGAALEEFFRSGPLEDRLHLLEGMSEFRIKPPIGLLTKLAEGSGPEGERQAASKCLGRVTGQTPDAGWVKWWEGAKAQWESRLVLVVIEGSAEFKVNKADLIWSHDDDEAITYEQVSDTASSRNWTVIRQTEENWIWWPQKIEFPLNSVKTLASYEGVLNGKPVSANPLTAQLPGKQRKAPVDEQ
jgi:serine/threonine protein kinase